jgi:hypothetical protein
LKNKKKMPRKISQQAFFHKKIIDNGSVIHDFIQQIFRPAEESTPLFRSPHSAVQGVG